MKFRKSFINFLLAILPISMSSCSLGMLLFYRESKTSTVYKSLGSKKDYFKIYVTTLSHCGCTQLTIINYKKGKRDFIIGYGMGTYNGKSIYKYNSMTKEKNTVWLKLTTLDNYTIKFNSMYPYGEVHV